MMSKNIFSYYLLKFTGALHCRLSDMFPQDFISILSILTVSNKAVLKAFFHFLLVSSYPFSILSAVLINDMIF